MTWTNSFVLSVIECIEVSREVLRELWNRQYMDPSLINQNNIIRGENTNLFCFGSIWSSPCQTPCEFLSSLGVHRLLTFKFSFFFSETEESMGYLLQSLQIFFRSVSYLGRHKQFLIVISRIFKKKSSPLKPLYKMN